MASIAEWIERIKTAIYGEEVRGAIWQSLEAMNTEVEAINVDGDQIQTNKTNIAANTAAITALNSSLTPVDLTATISFDDRVQADSLRVYKAGRIVMITGGIGAKGNSDIQFTNGQTIASGFPKPTQMAVCMAIPFRTAGTERVPTRTRIAIDGSLAPYWDTVTIPKSGQVLVFNLMYFSET